MPVNRKKMAALKEQYGDERGERIYHAMEQKEKKKKGGKGMIHAAKSAAGM